MNDFGMAEMTEIICQNWKLSHEHVPAIHRRLKDLIQGGMGKPTTEVGHGKRVKYDAATLVKCAVALMLEDQGYARAKMLKMANAWDRATDSRLAGCPLKIGKYQPPRAVDHAIYDANSEGSPEWFLLKITRRYSGELEPVIISTFVRADQTFEEEDPFCLNGILKKGNILELGEVLEVLTDYQNVTPLIQSFLPVIFED